MTALVIDAATGTVLLDGKLVRTTQVEFALLTVLARNPSRLISQHDLTLEVHGSYPAKDTRAIDSHLSRVRSKLAGASTRFIVNVWGRGYRLVEIGCESAVEFVGAAPATRMERNLADALAAMEALGEALTAFGEDLKRAGAIERERTYGIARPTLRAVGS